MSQYLNKKNKGFGENDKTRNAQIPLELTTD